MWFLRFVRHARSAQLNVASSSRSKAIALIAPVKHPQSPLFVGKGIHESAPIAIPRHVLAASPGQSGSGGFLNQPLALHLHRTSTTRDSAPFRKAARYHQIHIAYLPSRPARADQDIPPRNSYPGNRRVAQSPAAAPLRSARETPSLYAPKALLTAALRAASSPLQLLALFSLVPRQIPPKMLLDSLLLPRRLAESPSRKHHDETAKRLPLPAHRKVRR